MTGAKREHLTTGQSDEARTACMACNCKPLAFFQARSTPTPGAQCLMLAAAAAAVFACGRRRPGPAGQSLQLSQPCSCRAAGVAGQQVSSVELESKLLQFQARSTKDYHIASQNADRTPPPPWPWYRYSSEGNTTSTSLLYIHGPHHTSTEGNAYQKKKKAQKEMGALQVTVLAGISPQPGSLSLKRARQQSRLRHRIMWLHYTTSCHTYYAGPTVSFDHELMPDAMRFQFLLSCERPKQNSDCW
jgi:hypothetical protein